MHWGALAVPEFEQQLYEILGSGTVPLAQRYSYKLVRISEPGKPSATTFMRVLKQGKFGSVKLTAKLFRQHALQLQREGYDGTLSGATTRSVLKHINALETCSRTGG